MERNFPSVKEKVVLACGLGLTALCGYLSIATLKDGLPDKPDASLVSCVTLSFGQQAEQCDTALAADFSYINAWLGLASEVALTGVGSFLTIRSSIRVQSARATAAEAAVEAKEGIAEIESYNATADTEIFINAQEGIENLEEYLKVKAHRNDE